MNRSLIARRSNKSCKRLLRTCINAINSRACCYLPLADRTPKFKGAYPRPSAAQIPLARLSRRLARRSTSIER